jgi:hypothetical protein
MKYRDAVSFAKDGLLLIPRKKPPTNAVFSAMEWLFRVPSSKARARPEERADSVEERADETIGEESRRRCECCAELVNA